MTEFDAGFSDTKITAREDEGLIIEVGDVAYVDLSPEQALELAFLILDVFEYLLPDEEGY